MTKDKKAPAAPADADGSLDDQDLDGVSGGGLVLEERALGGPDTKSSTQLGPAPHLGPQPHLGPEPHLIPDGSKGGT